MTLRSLWPVCCAAVLSHAAIGCRSAGLSTPTFATHQNASHSLIAESTQRGRTAPAALPNASAPTADPAGTATSEESPLSRLIGRFGKPKPIPLPRTDLDQPGEDQHDTDSAGDLANAF